MTTPPDGSAETAIPTSDEAEGLGETAVANEAPAAGAGRGAGPGTCTDVGGFDAGRLGGLVFRFGGSGGMATLRLASALDGPRRPQT